MRRQRLRPTAAVWLATAVGIVVLAVAYDGGGYALESRSTIAIAVWWAILLGVALGVWPVGRITRGALVPGVLLALFAAWTLASTAWASSAEAAFVEFDRTALYLGIYVLVVVAVDRRRLGAWIDGLAVGITAIGLIALTSRLFPGSFPGRGLPASLPNARSRLSFPLDYWNGLGIFVALAVPLLLGSALGADRRRRAAAIAVLPALGSVVYLTSSRGAVAAAAVATAVVVAAQPRRWAALGAAITAASGSVAAAAMLASRLAPLDGPLGSAAARREGWQAALLLLVICLATAALIEAAVALAPRLPVPGRGARRLVAAALALAVVAGVAAIYQARAVQDFTRPPVVAGSSGSGAAVGEHLLSGSSSGRWQFWTAALDEFSSAPVHGRGAGSFEAWWDRHASFRYTVKDAHSLFLETLGELGVVGFLLLVGALAAGVVVAVRRLVGAGGGERTAIAGLLGAFTAYLVGAGVDWMWELTAVTAVGVCVLGLLAGPATLPRRSSQAGRRERGRSRRALALAAALGAAAAAIAVAEAIPLLTDIEVRRSQADVRAGNLGLARSHARAATELEPWAATPFLQLALVEENAGNLPAARRAIDEAIHRHRDDWRAWLVAARIQSRLGDPAAASRSRARAQSLNPLSPLLSEDP